MARARTSTQAESPAIPSPLACPRCGSTRLKLESFEEYYCWSCFNSFYAGPVASMKRRGNAVDQPKMLGNNRPTKYKTRAKSAEM